MTLRNGKPTPELSKVSHPAVIGVGRHKAFFDDRRVLVFGHCTILVCVRSGKILAAESQSA
jgi:hypothetical protein